MRFGSLHVVSRDLAQSETFYVDILGGTDVRRGDDAVRVQLGDFDVEFGLGPGNGAALGAEYPHCGLTVTPEQFYGIKRRLDAYGVPTNEPWTRGIPTNPLSATTTPVAMMYFRDPAGNQFELYSRYGCDAIPLRLSSHFGGDYETDFTKLAYEQLRTPTDGDGVPCISPAGFNHVTMPVRDLSEGKRFLTNVLGGEFVFELPGHFTAAVGASQIGIAPQASGWTASDAFYPHFGLDASLSEFRILRERLRTFGIPAALGTSDRADAWLYFRDPSGNLWKVTTAIADDLELAELAPTASRQLDTRALCYEHCEYVGVPT